MRTFATKPQNELAQPPESKSCRPVTSPAESVLQLQRMLGNQVTRQFFQSGVIQAKLTVGQPGDVYEQEADRVAEQVMRMPDSVVQLQQPEEEEKLQTKTDSTVAPTVDPALEGNINNLRGGGQPLPGELRDYFEPRFGCDFGQVRVHTDSSAAGLAQAVNARAFTLGQDVVFGAGQYAPEHEEGKKLVAHELTHVIQQKQFHQMTGIQAKHRLLRSELSSVATIASEKIQRIDMPDMPPVKGQLTLSIKENGAVEVRAIGPEDTPVVKSPTIGIGRDPDGKWHILVGGKDTVVTVDQIPAMLRSAYGGGSKPGGKAATKFRVPTSSQLWLTDQGRFMTYNEYKVSQMLSPSLMPLTPALYEALIESYTPQQIQIPKPPPSEKGDFPAGTLPEGMGYA